MESITHQTYLKENLSTEAENLLEKNPALPEERGCMPLREPPSW